MAKLVGCFSSFVLDEHGLVYFIMGVLDEDEDVLVDFIMDYSSLLGWGSMVGLHLIGFAWFRIYRKNEHSQTNYNCATYK